MNEYPFVFVKKKIDGKLLKYEYRIDCKLFNNKDQFKNLIDS
jgi:hypothetical protein